MGPRSKYRDRKSRNAVINFLLQGLGHGSRLRCKDIYQYVTRATSQRAAVPLATVPNVLER